MPRAFHSYGDRKRRGWRRSSRQVVVSRSRRSPESLARFGARRIAVVAGAAHPSSSSSSERTARSVHPEGASDRQSGADRSPTSALSSSSRRLGLRARARPRERERARERERKKERARGTQSVKRRLIGQLGSFGLDGLDARCARHPPCFAGCHQSRRVFLITFRA